jgi:hypothetical protein
VGVVDVKSVYGTTIKQYYIGASTDTKPSDVQIGARFLESDTNTTYIFGSDRVWYIDPEHQSLNKVWDAGSLSWNRMTQPLVNISNASFYTNLASMLTVLGSVEKQLDPLARYAVAYQDGNSATSYYGFQDRDGGWYVMRISNGSYLYYAASNNFDTGWGSRATLSFTSFAGAF